MSLKGLSIPKLLSSYPKQVSHCFPAFAASHDFLMPMLAGGKRISHHTGRGPFLLPTYSTTGFVVCAMRNPHLEHPLQTILGRNRFINGILVQFAPKLRTFPLHLLSAEPVEVGTIKPKACALVSGFSFLLPEHPISASHSQSFRYQLICCTIKPTGYHLYKI